MFKMTIIACAIASVSCSSATAPRTPTAPSIQGTVYYPSGDSVKVSGTSGYWSIGTPNPNPYVLIIANPDTPAPFDSLRPPLTAIEVTLTGARFTTFPQAITLSLGANAGGDMGAQLGVGVSLYSVTSGTASVSSLGGGYAHIDLVLASAALTFRGAVEVPNGCPSCVPPNQRLQRPGAWD